MADGTIRDNIETGWDTAEKLLDNNPASSSQQNGAAPLPKNPDLPHLIWRLNKQVFGDFYNTFRLIGYSAQIFYSSAVRAMQRIPAIQKFKWHQVSESAFHPSIIKTDWRYLPRAIVNVGETVAFLGAAIYARHRDRKQFRSSVVDVVAAEIGKDREQVTTKDIVESDNPIVQTAMNRFKTLYTLRFIQPLTFLYGLHAGLITTVTEIVAERAAYFERNSYDHLQKRLKEVSNNQWGTWSRDALMAQLVNVIQENRAEHEAPPIGMQELQQYFPVLQKMSDRIIEKKWNFAETLYVLGQIIKEPANYQKAEQLYDAIEAHGLSGIAKIKQSGGVIATAAASSSAEMQQQTHSQALKEILARGPKTPAMTAEHAPSEAKSGAMVAGI